jgi:Sulfotransferase family
MVEEQERLRHDKKRAAKKLANAKRQIAELKAHVAELSAAVPVAVGDDASSGRPLGYLFVVAYGRSGSTLVQGLLDAIPGYLIRGENRGVLYRLYQYHSALEKARNDYGRADALTSRDSWYGIDEYSGSVAVARLRSMMLETLLKPAPDTRVVGFKEIRWFYDDWEEFLAFVQEMFPGARFVINTRDHEAVANSQWWGKRPKGEVLELLAGYEKQLTAMADKLGDAAYRVHYDDYVADPGTLRGLFEWLGEPFDEAAVTETMAVKHSF